MKGRILGILRYGSSHLKPLEAKYEPLYFPTHNINKNNMIEHKMAQTLTWMGVLALTAGALLLAKHFSNVNEELDETFDSATTAFDSDW